MSKTVGMPSAENPAVLESLPVRIAEPCERERCHQLVDEHHYCGWSLIAPVSAASKTVCINVWTFPTTMTVAGFAIRAPCSWPVYGAGSATASSWSGALTNLIPSI